MTRASELRRLGGYDLEACIAAGATTQVYQARSPHSPCPLAIKLLAPSLTVYPELVARFREEAELSVQLSHPNLPESFASGISSGVPFLVMERLQGMTLAQLLERLEERSLQLPVGAALTVARDACRALGYAHHLVTSDGVHRQIIHADVSPSNLFLCKNGVIKLIDFGVARVAGPFDSDVTAAGEGKHAYMAPEQARGEPIDRRVDVFAMGVVLHEMLTGRPLFTARTPLETMRRAASAEIEPPSSWRPGVPKIVDGIVRRALARDRAQRYPSGAAMARALDALAGLLYSRRAMAELVHEQLTDVTCPDARRGDQDTVPIAVPERVPLEEPGWGGETARMDVG